MKLRQRIPYRGSTPDVRLEVYDRDTLQVTTLLDPRPRAVAELEVDGRWVNVDELVYAYRLVRAVKEGAG